MSRVREQRRIASVYSQLLNEAEIDKNTGKIKTRPGVLPTPGQIIQQQDASDRIARQSTLATQAGAAVDIVKLINAVRANDQQTIQQISSKYSTTANEDAEESTGRVNTGFARSGVLDGFVTVFQNLDKAETVVLLKMLNENLPKHEFVEFLTNLTKHPGFKQILPKLGDIKKMLGGYQQEMGMPQGV